MLTLVMVVSRTPRRALRSLRPSSHSRFGSHLNLIPEKIAPFLSCTYEMQISQPLCFDIHTKCPGGYPPPQCLGVQICESKLNCSCGAEIPIRSGRFDVFPIYPVFFHIHAHSFALFCTQQKLKSFHFKRFRTLCQKYPGWGYPPSLEEEQNETADCQFRRSIPSLVTLHYRRRSGRFGWDGGKEGTSARKNH
jgi:hypothetical protein